MTDHDPCDRAALEDLDARMAERLGIR